MARKKSPETVLILGTTSTQVGWSLEVNDSVAALMIPALGKPKRKRKTSAIELELHTPDKTFVISCKCATITVKERT